VVQGLPLLSVTIVEDNETVVIPITSSDPYHLAIVGFFDTTVQFFRERPDVMIQEPQEIAEGAERTTEFSSSV
jgi:hypothetical protein